MNGAPLFGWVIISPMFRWICLTCCLLLFVSACIPIATKPLPTVARFPDTATPSASPLPTTPSPSSTPEISSPTPPEASPTAETTFTPIPTDTLAPIPTLDGPLSLTGTPPPQPAADSGAIQFLGPGPLSKVVSPIKAYGYAIPGHDNKGRLDLYGEDGHLLATQLVQTYTPYKWAYFTVNLPFTINNPGELGRLTLSTQDDNGRLVAVNSVVLLLLSEGASIINPHGNLRERCVIDLPKVGKHVSGGVLSVAGEMRPFNSLPITVEIINPDGTTLGTQSVTLPAAQGDVYLPFRADFPYRVSSGESVLLVVKQNDERIGGIMYLYSQEVYLNP